MLQNKKGINFKKAFTLIELLVVVAIISLLSAVVLNSVASARMKANDTKITEDLRSFRKAAELYYNDNKIYPATNPSAINNQETVLATSNVQKNSWAHKLAFFTKTAEAQTITSPHSTVLCKNFDIAAGLMVNSKYLASVPVHPYDNDATGVCYKAVRSASGNTFSGYGALTTIVDLAGGGSMSKRSGFVTGDVSSDGINGLVVATDIVNEGLPDDKKEIVYPAGLDGNPLVGNASLGNSASLALVTVDRVDGVTNGVTAPSCPSGQSYDLTTKACRTLLASGDRVNSVTCQSPYKQNPFTDECVGTDGVPACSAGYVWSSSYGVCLSDGTVAGLCPVGYTYTDKGNGGICHNPAIPGPYNYKCPSDRPLWVLDINWGTVNGKCGGTQQCPGGTSFIPGTEKCACSAGSTWMSDPSRGWGCAIFCPNGQEYDMSARACRPLFPNGNRVNSVTCQSPYIQSHFTDSCIVGTGVPPPPTCSAGYVWSSWYSKCVSNGTVTGAGSCPVGYAYINNGNGSLCQNPATSPSTYVCPTGYSLVSGQGTTTDTCIYNI